MIKGTVYFISAAIIPKKDGGGGSVVIYRHLKRLEAEGYKVLFINCNVNVQAVSDFKQINIKKKFWHPPLRKFLPYFTNFRFKLNFLYLKKLINFTQGDIVLSLLEDQGSLLAYTIYKETNIPYFLFFHDDNVFNKYFDDHLLHHSHLKKIIKACSRFFAVSEPMQNLLLEKGAKNVTHIYPIPEGGCEVKKLENVHFEQLNLCYAGMILPFHDELIKKIYQASIKSHTQLSIVSAVDEYFKARFEKLKKIQFIDRKPTMEALFSFLLSKIDVIIIFYSFDLNEELRASHSFPSKFTEYCHLGIPTMIIAPPQSSIGKWALQNNWLSYVNSDDQDQIEMMINQLKEREFWAKCSQQCIEVASTIFNPENIHQKLLEIINE